MADRSDEARDDKRQGDVLGLGGVTGGHHAVNSLGSEDQERRRRRMREGIDEMATGTSEIERLDRREGHGEASVDMGAGGDGTDVER